MDLGDMVDLVVDLGSDMSDNRGSHHLLTDLVNRDDGLVNSVVNLGNRNRGSSHSRGGSNSGNSWGSMSNSNSGSRSSSILSSNNCRSSNTSKTSIANTSKASIAKTSKVLSISFSSRGSHGSSHKGRQSDEGLHCDLC